MGSDGNSDSKQIYTTLVQRTLNLKDNEKAEEQAFAVMHAHIDALNKRDADALSATLHFPHHRLSGVEWKTWETADHYFEDFLKRVGNDWNRSLFNDIKVLDSSANKVHLDAEIQRFDANDKLISRFRSLWVIINIEGAWAAKVRSSFASK